MLSQRGKIEQDQIVVDDRVQCGFGNRRCVKQVDVETRAAAGVDRLNGGEDVVCDDREFIHWV